MSRPRRPILSAAMGLSMLVCIATALLWVWSYKGLPSWGAADWVARRHHFLDVTRGEVSFSYGYLILPGRGGRVVEEWSILGFSRWEMVQSGQHWYVWRVPCWALVGTFGGWPLVINTAFRHTRRRRRSNGLCTSCGYNLRATPDRCPECGKVAEVAGTAPTHSAPAAGAG